MKRHRTADLDPTSFGGRYTLLRRLAVGGMAEIYLARQAAMAGFEKDVVIKRLRAELADDPRIVEMFLDEARIGALLNHPNIVHVYDVDEHDGIPYIAMEYIIGEELNELCRRGLAHDRFLPLEHAVELIRQAAAGMGYFHAKRTAEAAGADGANGEPMEIVHLDISPTNLMVTQDGFLKIIDFGIANARGSSQRTDVLPGKLGYMSPEQAARTSVDHRSDVFSLGIVLYEITVGRRLFRGSAQDVVNRLVDATVPPPTFVRRNFPTALESIVMRTLEKHPDDRYQTAYDLADDLEAFLRDERMHSGPVRIARYLDMLTAAGGGARRPELVTEAEARAAGSSGDEEQLDFDQQMFDAFKPAAGAPGPEQSADWEEIEQPEADVAAALGIELAELRALRTPVPARPAGMPIGTQDVDTRSPNGVPAVDDKWELSSPLAGSPSDAPDTDGTGAPALIHDAPPESDDAGVTTNPLERVEPAAAAAPPPAARTSASQMTASASAGTGPQPAIRKSSPTQPPPIPPAAVNSDRASGSKPALRPSNPPSGSGPQPTVRPSSPVTAPAVPAPAARPSTPDVASARASESKLPQAPSSLAQRLPWILVGALIVALAALVAYMVAIR